MKPVFSNPQLVVVTQMRDLLEREGIATQIRNEYAAGAAGELAPIDAWPELWLRSERDRDHALKLIQRHQRGATGPDWRCARCGADCPDSFDWCWQCGAER